MMNPIPESLSDIRSSDHEENGEDEEDIQEHTELGKLSEDDEPGWGMGTISKTAQQHMSGFRQKWMKLDEVTQLGRRDIADNFHQRHMKYWTAEIKVPYVVKPHTENDTAGSALQTFGELMETLDIAHQMLQGTPQQGCRHMRPGSGKQKWNKCIASLPTNAIPDSSPIMKAQSVEPVSVYPCI